MDEFMRRLIELGIEPDAAKQMQRYAQMMLEVNRIHNLTRITEPVEMAEKHFYDSLAPDRLGLIPKGAVILDVGTGGGFPGIPLAILRPDLQVTLLDSSEKKINFVKTAAEKIGISCSCLVGRAEELSELRGSFDLVVSRAVAALPMLLELCAPFIKRGGRMIAYKGVGAESEMGQAAHAAQTLGLAIGQCIPAGIREMQHNLIVYRKTGNTPAQYPRRFAKIKSSPL